MKKTIEWLVLIVLIVMLFGCGKRFSDKSGQIDSTQEPSTELINETEYETVSEVLEMSAEEPTSTGLEGEITVAADGELPIQVEQVRGVNGYTVLTLISNRRELDQYLKESRFGYAMSGRWSELSEKYDEKWFDSHVLLTIPAGGASCDYFDVRWVRLNEGHLEVCVDKMHKSYYEKSEAEKESLLAELETGEVSKFGDGHDCDLNHVELVVEIEGDRELFEKIQFMEQCWVQHWELPAYYVREVEVEVQRMTTDEGGSE